MYEELDGSPISQLATEVTNKGLQDVVGRPVISNCGSATEHISEFLDFHLNP